MKMGAQIRTGTRLPDTGKRFTRPNQVSESFSGIGKSFSGADLYPHFHVAAPALDFFSKPLCTAETFAVSFDRI